MREYDRHRERKGGRVRERKTRPTSSQSSVSNVLFYYMKRGHLPEMGGTNEGDVCEGGQENGRDGTEKDRKGG